MNACKCYFIIVLNTSESACAAPLRSDDDESALTDSCSHGIKSPKRDSPIPAASAPVCVVIACKIH
jgi:hypothetical protein